MRRGVPGALVGVGDGGERAADRGRGFSGRGEGGQIDGDQRGRGGQGRGAAVVAPFCEAAPVAVIGAPGGGGAARFDVDACGADFGVADGREGRGLLGSGRGAGAWKESMPDGGKQPRAGPSKIRYGNSALSEVIGAGRGGAKRVTAP